MKISVTEAKSKLAELVRRAEAGAEVVLTRYGEPVVRLVPVEAPSGREVRRKILAAVRSSAAVKATPGPSAARSQDFLYDKEGCPSD